MLRSRWRVSAAAAIATALIAVGALLAQGVLVQLGLTETAARNFLFDELKSPASSRRSAIVVTGNRAFLKLSPAARGQAASSLFAWAKTYVNSPAFKTAYANYRHGVIGEPKQYELSVDEEVKKKLDDQLLVAQQMRTAAESFPPAERDQLLATVKQQETWARDPATILKLKSAMEAERTQESEKETARMKEDEEKLPGDPQKLFARRLRQFLEGTANVNFSAKTLSLTGGPDGIEFIEPADRKQSWLWQEAAIVGQEATLAARAAAEAWLKEIEP
ncbi:MAG: hypothetical protein U0V70_10025 [Terriglobia bacterium]